MTFVAGEARGRGPRRPKFAGPAMLVVWLGASVAALKPSRRRRHAAACLASRFVDVSPGFSQRPVPPAAAARYWTRINITALTYWCLFGCVGLLQCFFRVRFPKKESHMHRVLNEVYL
jgi:hypothetical protein